jgi:hypothetical protein
MGKTPPHNSRVMSHSGITTIYGVEEMWLPNSTALIHSVTIITFCLEEITVLNLCIIKSGVEEMALILDE